MPFKDNNYQDRKKLVDGYESKIICFLDILGMSNFVEKAEKYLQSKFILPLQILPDYEVDQHHFLSLEPHDRQVVAGGWYK